jgi:hypothetical protein
MSHETLHHAEPKLLFCLMNMFELVWIWIGFEFDLKSIETIKRKAFGKFQKIEKPHSAHSAQPSPARPRARPLHLKGLPLPLYFHLFTLIGLLVAQPPQSTEVLTTSSPLLKRSRVVSRGNQPPHALNSPFPALLSMQSLAGVELRRHQATPPQTVPSGASALVSCPRLSPSCHPELDWALS